MKLITMSFAATTSITTTQSIINYKYIFLFLISIISIIFYYVIILNILIYFSVIDITFDNIAEVNIFNDIYPKYLEIPQLTNTNIIKNIDKSLFGIFVDLFKSTNTSIKYFPSYFVGSGFGSNCIRYENYSNTILELVYSQHFITLNNQELIYMNNLESIYNVMLNNMKEYSSTVNWIINNNPIPRSIQDDLFNVSEYNVYVTN
jgi:hypothetical protein